MSLTRTVARYSMAGAHKYAAGCPGSLEIRHFDMNVGDREKNLCLLGYELERVLATNTLPHGSRLNMFIAVRMLASDRY